MHLPDSMLHGAVCPVTVAVSAVGLLAVGALCVRSKDRPSALKFASLTALILAAQMVNFPILNGTSGHLLGGVLASSLLGLPFGILSMALVVTTQCLVFSDGGLFALGANLLNMALVGAGLGGLVHRALAARTSSNRGRLAALALASWTSVILASLAAAVELAVSGSLPLTSVVPAMAGVHALIGLGEALLTVGLFALLSKTSAWVSLAAAGATALVAAPFACGWPDGLESVAAGLAGLTSAGSEWTGLLAGYELPGLAGGLSTAAAGALGVAVVFGLAWAAAQVLAPRKQPVRL